MDHKNAWLALVIALLLASVLRFYKLTDYPPSLNWDEVSHAYNAWTLLKTGRDQWHQVLPILNFRAYGDYPTTLNLYMTVPAMAALGPVDLAARLPHALLGVLTVIMAFGMGYWWRRNRWQAAVAALLVAVEPWTTFTSRTVLQSNWTIFLMFAFLAFFLRSRTKNQEWWLPVGILGLALFSYHNARIYVPLVCLPLFLLLKGKLARIILLLVLATAAGIVLMPASRVRGNVVEILDSGAIAKLESERNNSTLPPILARLIYNRPVYFLEKAALNYSDYFSPQYLFGHGGTQYQFSVPNWGLVSWAGAPFFYLGIIILLWQTPEILVLFLLAPIPAAVTSDRFAVVRSTIMIPFVYLAITAGMVWVAGKFKNRLWVVVFILVELFFLVGYYINYFTVYTQNYSQSWQYGYKQAVNYALQKPDQFDQIIFTKRYGEPHEYVLWYSQMLSPADLDWNYHDNWYWVDGFGKFKFVNDWEMPQYVQHLSPGHYLIVASPDNPTLGTQVDQVNFLDGRPAYIIKTL